MIAGVVFEPNKSNNALISYDCIFVPSYRDLVYLHVGIYYILNEKGSLKRIF